MWCYSCQTYLNHCGSCCIPSCSLCLRRSRCDCSNWSFKVSAADRFPSSSNLHCKHEDRNNTAFTQPTQNIQWHAKFKIIFSWTQLFRYCVCASAAFCVQNLKKLIQLYTPTDWMIWNWGSTASRNNTFYFCHSIQTGSTAHPASSLMGTW
jgi:Na+/melibiose symporter-like transporter